MGEPAISIVVPTFNRAELLDRLLTALDKCSWPGGNVEIIVVDDGSTDRTPETVRRWPHVRYVHQPNEGPAAARNRGWQETQAPIVAFTDDDTVPDERWLLELVAPLQSDAGTGGVGGTIEPLVRGFLADFIQLERQVNHGVHVDGQVRWLVTANAAFRREALAEVGGFDRRFPRAAGEDVDLSFRIKKAGWRLETVPGATVLHDHRTTLRALYRTFSRHGEAAFLLDRLHPEFRSGGTGHSIKTLRYWTERYSYYRLGGAGRGASAIYVAMRLVGVAMYVSAMRRQRRIVNNAPL